MSLVIGTIATVGSPALREAAARRAPRSKVVAPKGVAPELVAQLVSELGSDKQETAVAAAKRLGELASAATLDPILERLAIGLPPAVAVEALRALGRLKSPQAVPVLALYAGNRNAP